MSNSTFNFPISIIIAVISISLKRLVMIVLITYWISSCNLLWYFLIIWIILCLTILGSSFCNSSPQVVIYFYLNANFSFLYFASIFFMQYGDSFSKKYLMSSIHFETITFSLGANSFWMSDHMFSILFWWDSTIVLKKWPMRLKLTNLLWQFV